MAHYMDLGNQTDIKWIFNVSYAVGWKCPNRWDDVMLIQHVLNTLLPTFEIKDSQGRLITSYLKRDGLFGPKTAEAILGYQRQAKEVRHKVITVDGMVNRANHTGWTSHTNDQYTIVHLNRDHRNVYGKMMNEADFPEKLRNLLLQKQR